VTAGLRRVEKSRPLLAVLHPPCALRRRRLHSRRSIPTSAFRLRHAEGRDREFLYALNEATMRADVESIGGWDESEQLAFFDNG
jgi:hypothetical protein